MEKVCVPRDSPQHTVTHIPVKVFEEKLSEPALEGRTLIMVFYPVSAFFLLLCLGITLAVPTLRSSMFGYMKISFLVSISSFFIFMTAMAYGGLTLILDHPFICRFIGYLTNFSFLASFFWLNTMSFDIWRTFSNMRAYGSMIHRIRSKRRRTVQYTLYAWGLPALTTLVSLLVDLSPIEVNLPRPDHGTRTCFFNNRAAKVAYQQVHFHLLLQGPCCNHNPLQAPISILLALNVIFFLLASHAICLGIWAPSASENIRQPRMQRFLIVIWLFIAMGLPWTLDLVSGYMHDWENNTTMLLIDMITALQGFMIFLIYTLKFGLWNNLVQFLRRRGRRGEKAGRKLSVERSTTNSLRLNSSSV